VSLRHREALNDVGADGTATFILGGQVREDPPDILLVYPEGNYIRASDERPFLQIGESKYGKFMLELAVETRVDLETATMIAIGSMMSTAAANLSVGPPYDVGVYLNDSMAVEGFRLDSDSPILGQLRETWERHLLQGVAELQSISHEEFAVELPNALVGPADQA
jgi:putative proteasome-type protease